MQPAEWMKTRRRLPRAISPGLATQLRDLKPQNANPGDRVFAGVMSRTEVVETLRRDLERAGIEVDNEEGRIDFHVLRHTSASLVAQAGADVAQLQAHTGHTTSAMVSRYLHPAPVAPDLFNSLNRFGTQIGTTEGAQSGGVETKTDASVRSDVRHNASNDPRSDESRRNVRQDEKYPVRDLNPCRRRERAETCPVSDARGEACSTPAQVDTSSDTNAVHKHPCEADLARVVEAWPTLPAPIRQAVLAMLDPET